MILSNDDVDKRLSSSNNLLNRLNILTGNGLGVKESHRPTVKDDEIVETPAVPESPEPEDLIENLEAKINLGLAQKTALEVLNASALQLLERVKCYDVDDPKTLSKIASDMGKIVTGIRNSENKKNESPVNQQVIIWKPIVQHESHYEHIMVNE